MAFKEDFIEATEILKKNKFRAFLSGFGIFWGIFLLIILLASGDGLEKGVKNRFKGMDLSSFHLYTRNTKMAYKGLQENRKIIFTNEDYKLLKRKFQHNIKYISARSYFRELKLVKRGNKYDNYDIYGVEPQAFFIRKINIVKGRYINQQDVNGNRNVAVIGLGVKDYLFNKANPIGKNITIENNTFKIVGVFNSLKDGEAGNKENDFILIPHSSFQVNFNRVNMINNIGIVLKSQNSEENILNFLKKIKNVHPKDRGVYTVNTRKDYLKFQGLFQSIRIFMWVVGLGTLFSGIVGVSNIMIISVKERTKEIGIRKAIGATPFKIIKVILIESIFLTAIAGYIGLSIGLILVEGINYTLKVFNLNNEFFINPEINMPIVIASLFILLVAGFFAAFFPARKAALVKPIESLRDN